MRGSTDRRSIDSRSSECAPAPIGPNPSTTGALVSSAANAASVPPPSDRSSTRRRFPIDLAPLWDYGPPTLVAECICGDIMSGIASPSDCPLFGRQCVPDNPVGACMVSSEGTCKIWHQYGGHPDLAGIA